MYTSETSSGRISPKSINVPRNKFNKSKARFFELPMGAIAPFHVERLLPNDTIDTSYDVNVELRNPLKKPIMNNIRFYTKSYVCRDVDLWEGALRYHDKGIRQDQALEMPKLLPYALSYVEDTPSSDPWENLKTSTTYKHWYSTLTPLTPWDYMGLPWCHYAKKGMNGTTERAPKYSGRWQDIKKGTTTIAADVIEQFYYEGEGTTPLEVTALPFVMYAKIKRKDFCDSNLSLLNKGWFPDQDDHFRLPYNCDMNNYGHGHNTKNYVNCLEYNQPLKMRAVDTVVSPNILPDNTGISSSYQIPQNTTQTNDNLRDACPKLNVLFYAPWRMDYYTGASPFADLIRNGTTIPSISLNVNEDVKFRGNTEEYPINSTLASSTQNLTWDLGSAQFATSSGSASVYATSLEMLFKNMFKLANENSSFNIMDLRNALAKTLICERIGLIENHDFYNGYMNTIYGSNIHGECHDPIYIGGGYFDWNNSIVENQNAPSSDNDLPLGYIGANGNANGHINGGVYTSQDFGWFMSVIYAIPDTIYNGGIEKEWNKLTQSTDYNPLLQGTSPATIEKRELGLPSGKNGWEAIKTAWGFTKRDEEYKSSVNKISGFGACKTNDFILDQSYFIKREFSTETAILNESNIECTPDNCKSYSWASTTEPEFRVMAQCNCYITREMLKSAEPSNMGMFN